VQLLGRHPLDCGIRVLYIDELLHLTGVVVVEAEPVHVAGYRRRAGSGIVRRDVRRQAARVRQHPPSQASRRCLRGPPSRLSGLWGRWGRELTAEARRVGGTVRLTAELAGQVSG
jgi:hypothetical protein